MSALLLPSRLRQQPQQGAQLDRSHRFAANAQAILSAPQDVNYATGKQLTRGGAGYTNSALPAGKAWPFRKNFYVETEVLPAIGTASFVEFWYGYPGAGGVQGATTPPAFVTGSNLNQFGIFSVRGSGFDGNGGNHQSWGAVYRWDGGTLLNSAEDILTPGQLTLLVVVRRPSGMEFWRDGRMVRYIAQSPISYPAETLICGSFIRDKFWTSTSDTILAGRVLTPNEPTASEVRAFSENPWLLYQAPRDRAALAAVAGYAPTVVDTSLSGGAAAQSSASGALSTQVRLSAAVVAQAVANSVLSTQVRLAGSSNVAAGAAGALLTSIPLAGSAASQVGAAGALSTVIDLTSSASVVAGAAGALSTSISLSGAATAQASASGSLALQVAALTGSAVSQASAGGTLSTAVSLSGAALARSSAGGTLLGAGAALAGAAVSGANAGGALLTTIRLLGAADCAATVSGSFAGSAAVLAGSAVARSSSGADLSTAIVLGGQAASRSSSSGALATWIALTGSAAASTATVGYLDVGTRYARAPEGSGYLPHRVAVHARPAQFGGYRLASIQRNNR